MEFFAALKFLTIIPLFRHHQDSVKEIQGSLVYYPVVGLVIGLILVGLNWVFGLLLPRPLTNGLLLVSLVIITGALHLDGFSDTCDGIAGHKPAEARWQVMRDSRTGAFGVVGVTLLLLMKYVSLNSLGQAMVIPALLLMPVLSRWAMVYAIFAYLYARSEGLGKTIKQAANWQRFAVATVITLLLAILVTRLATGSYLAGAAIMLGVWVIIVIAAAFFRRMFNGLTGDNYGAINELAELGALLLANLLVYNRWLV